MHLQYRHLDADPGAELARPQTLRLALSCSASTPSSAASRSSCSPWSAASSRTASSAARCCSISQYVQMGCAFLLTAPDRLPCRPRLADPLPLVRRRLRPGLRRTGLPGADSHPGRQRGHAERHRAAIHPVQRGARHRSGARRHRADPVGREMVLRAQRHLLPCAHHFPLDAQGPLLSAEDLGIDSRRHEAGHRLHPQTERHGGPHGAGLLHDRSRRAHADLPPGLRQGHLPSGARHVYRCSSRSPASVRSSARSPWPRSAMSTQRPHRAIMLTCLGAAIAGFALSTRSG